MGGMNESEGGRVRAEGERFGVFCGCGRRMASVDVREVESLRRTIHTTSQERSPATICANSCSYLYDQSGTLNESWGVSIYRGKGGGGAHFSSYDPCKQLEKNKEREEL